MQGLLLHRGTHSATRAEIAKIETPRGTGTWRPVPHIELIETLETTLGSAGYEVADESFGVGRAGALMFGVLKLFRPGFQERGDGALSVGLRQANDRTMSVQICAGLSVFVCDNLVFRGDMIALSRKHTSGIEIGRELDAAVDKLQAHFGTLGKEIERMKSAQISDTGAKAMMHEVFVEQRILPLKYIEGVSANYFKPPHPEFEARTQWSLHNAFTEEMKKMPITTRFGATQRLGRYFGLTNAH